MKTVRLHDNKNRFKKKEKKTIYDRKVEFWERSWTNWPDDYSIYGWNEVEK